MHDQMSSPPPAHDHDDMASFMQCEVKKEMDLVEIISHVNL